MLFFGQLLLLLNFHYSEARINAVRNLLLGDFCIVLTTSGIRIGEGMLHTNFAV